MKKKIITYDTTLRDGAQAEDISFSVHDKLRIARKLDDLGITYIEGGWPGSNPRDMEFFDLARKINLNTARMTAFGSTRKPGIDPSDDPNLQALLKAKTPSVTIFGKTWDLHVRQVMSNTLEENLAMITDSVEYLKSGDREVIYDAEHFFDGYKANPDYALKTLMAAIDAGAEFIVLCDTNGGSLPIEIKSIIDEVRKAFSEKYATKKDSLPVKIGIHTHNDSGLAVANSIEAVQSGAVMVQGTINGYGERCGNANLCSIIPMLKLKMGINCVTDEQLAKLTEVSHYIGETANLVPDTFLPYVGSSAFSHKAGLHVAGLRRWADSYQHIDPTRVGNQPKVLVSELSGKGTIIQKARERGLDLPLQGKEAQELLEQVKLMENQGFQYDNAEASFDLLVHRAKPNYRLPFELVDFMVVIEKRRRLPTQKGQEEMLSEAIVKVRVGTEIRHTVAEGNGPVNALDQALRKALLQSYPSLAKVKLIDYKVRILEESGGTGSQVRVLIESSDGVEQWRTVGSSTNIIEASWLALADSLEYWLLKQNH